MELLRQIYSVKVHLALTTMMVVLITFFTNIAPANIVEDFGVFGALGYAIGFCSMPWIFSGIIALVFKFAWFSRLLVGSQFVFILILLNLMAK